MSDSATLWTVAHQAPLSLGLSRQEYSSGLPRPPPGELPDPGNEPGSPALAGGLFATSATWEASSGFSLRREAPKIGAAFYYCHSFHTQNCFYFFSSSHKEIIVQSEVRKRKYRVLTHLCGVEKNSMDDLIAKQKERHRGREQMYRH